MARGKNFGMMASDRGRNGLMAESLGRLRTLEGKAQYHGASLTKNVHDDWL